MKSEIAAGIGRRRAIKAAIDPPVIGRPRGLFMPKVYFDPVSGVLPEGVKLRRS